MTATDVLATLAGEALAVQPPDVRDAMLRALAAGGATSVERTDGDLVIVRVAGAVLLVVPVAELERRVRQLH